MTFLEFKSFVESLRLPVVLEDRGLYMQARAVWNGIAKTYEYEVGSQEEQDFQSWYTNWNLQERDKKGVAFVAIKKPSISGTKVKTHDFGRKETWYSMSTPTTIGVIPDPNLPTTEIILPSAVNVHSPYLAFGDSLSSVYPIEGASGRAYSLTAVNTFPNGEVEGIVQVPPDESSLTYPVANSSEFRWTAQRDCEVVDAALVFDQTATPPFAFIFAILDSIGNTLIQKNYKSWTDFLLESDLDRFRSIPSIGGEPAKYFFAWEYRQPIPLKAGQSLSLSLSHNNPLPYHAHASFSVQFL